MIILIILGVLLAIAIITFAVFFVKDNCIWEIAAFAMVVLIVSLIVAGGFAIGAKVGTKYDKAYIEMNSQYEVLVHRLENQSDHILEDTELYNDIVEYNTTVRQEKKLLDSKWIGIFYDKSIMKCKEIDLSAFSKGVQNDKDKS